MRPSFCSIANRRGSPYYVVLDSRAAAAIVVDHLAELGHTRIAHLAGRAGGFNAGERLAGYRDGLKRHGIRFDLKLVAVAGYTAEGGADAMRSLLALKPTALLDTTIVTAAVAIAVLMKRICKFRAMTLHLPRPLMGAPPTAWAGGSGCRPPRPA